MKLADWEYEVPIEMLNKLEREVKEGRVFSQNETIELIGSFRNMIRHIIEEI
jgi:hypothetical protein